MSRCPIFRDFRLFRLVGTAKVNKTYAKKMNCVVKFSKRSQIYRTICQWSRLGGKSTAYNPPPWYCHELSASLEEMVHVPLAQLPTPIHAWKLPGLPKGYEVFIKRDDMTGCTLSGNKVRKLEFLLADALRKGCNHVITCGGIQSNHCRVTTVAATQLGLQSHLVLRTNLKSTKEAVYHGNLFLDRVCGAELYFVSQKTPYETELKPRMERIAEKIKSETGQLSYLIPVGGSSLVGLHGYLAGFQEMLQQGLLDHVTDVVFACGSGGTAEGLALANYLAANSKLGIHGVAVCDNADYFHAHCDHMLQEIGLASLGTSRDILDIVDGYKGEGYGLSTQEELEFLVEVSRSTGIILDPTYTGKAARGLVLELHRNPARFKGNRILFIHTGGIFGAMDDRLDETLQRSRHLPRRSYMWTDKEKDPWS